MRRVRNFESEKKAVLNIATGWAFLGSKNVGSTWMTARDIGEGFPINVDPAIYNITSRNEQLFVFWLSNLHGKAAHSKCARRYSTRTLYN